MNVWSNSRYNFAIGVFLSSLVGMVGVRRYVLKLQTQYEYQASTF
jgi:hypothetical protein